MGEPIVHWEFASHDAERLRSFYEALFQWQVDDDNPMGYGLVKTGTDEGVRGGIVQARAGMPSYLTFYVQVDDLERHLSMVESLGGRVIVRESPIPGVGSFALFSDPDGNLVGLYAEAPSLRG